MANERSAGENIMRKGEITRKTKETQITLRVNLDGEGKVDVSVEPKFFEHLIKTFAVHSSVGIELRAVGDLKHHVIEDVAICLGGALDKALGERVGIDRFGYAVVPMDCSLALCAVDLVRRPYSKIDLKLEGKIIEDMSREDMIHFLETLASSLQANIHVLVLYGNNDHHKVEAAFKALALSLKQAMSASKKTGAPSAKGTM
jgi:imidazoleglycerol-phosphate dehydratase